MATLSKYPDIPELLATPTTWRGQMIRNNVLGMYFRFRADGKREQGPGILWSRPFPGMLLDWFCVFVCGNEQANRFFWSGRHRTYLIICLIVECHRETCAKTLIVFYFFFFSNFGGTPPNRVCFFHKVCFIFFYICFSIRLCKIPKAQALGASRPLATSDTATIHQLERFDTVLCPGSLRLQILSWQGAMVQ